MWTRLRFLVVPLVLLLLAVSAASAADKVKIGFISSFSTATTNPAPDMLDGFKLAIADSGNGLGGREVDLIVGDDQYKPDVGVLVARKMLDEDKVQIVTGIISSNVMLAVAHTVLPRKVFLLSLNSGPSQLAGPECSPYFFGVAFQNDMIGEAMGIQLQKQGVKNAYIISANYSAGRDLLAGFKRMFKGAIAGETYTALDQRDYAAELTNIRAVNPEAVFFFYQAGAPAINFVRQYAEAGLKGRVPLYSVYFSVDDEQTLPGMGDAAVGIQSSSYWSRDLDNPTNRAFVQHFEAAYHRRPSIFAANAYDTGRLIDSALRAVDGHIEQADAFRTALEAARFDSVRGNFAFSRNHFPIENAYLLEVVQDATGAIGNAFRGLIVRDQTDTYVSQCTMP
jgi:branched-chain amino acid transport system substrate-binding protein